MLLKIMDISELEEKRIQSYYRPILEYTCNVYVGQMARQMAHMYA